MCSSEALQRLALCEHPRIVVEDGGLTRLGELCRGLSVSRALLVSDRGLVAAGHTSRADESLRAAGIETKLFVDVSPNPNQAHAQACSTAATESGADVLVAVGGGSAMDTAKAAAFLVAGGGQMEDYWGRGKGSGEFLPIVAVPTTAGTGSETQSFALITRASDGRKMACGDKAAMPTIVLLDAQLTASAPTQVVAYAGLDCLTHAVESAVTTGRNPQSLDFSYMAFRLVNQSLSSILRGGDPEARRDMQLAASLSGLAIEHSMLGAAHALANPLTARVGLDHGRAVATVLPHVIRFNAEAADVAEAYVELCQAAGIEGGAPALASRVESWLEEAEVPRSLDAAGVERGDLEALAVAAAREWTAGFNPRPVDPQALQAILLAAL